MSSYKSKIIGTGSYLPKKLLTNKDMEQIVDTTEEWILSRSGIKQRHIAAEDEFTSDLALKAAENAIKNAGIDKNTIDQIIVATTSSDLTFPATAAKLQQKLGLSSIASFDIQAVCAGFVYAISVADSIIKAGTAKTILVVGAEKMSAITDWTDRGTCVLFGDGAGAIILSRTEEDSASQILGCKLHSDGNFGEILYTDGGAGTTGTSGKVRMLGKEVFKHAVDKMSTTSLELLKDCGFTVSDLKWLIPHQANIRILDAVANKLNIEKDKVIITLDVHANTSAASIPLALDDANKKGLIKKGDLILLTAIGGGLSWGSVLLRF